MHRKNKNLLIGGLLAIVFVMAVGFAGFTQRLTINETSGSSNSWNVNFASATASPACSSSVTNDCGTVTTFSAGATSITFNTKFSSPGHSVTYTVVVQNKGNVKAKLNDITQTESNSSSLINYTVSGITEGSSTIAANANLTFTVTVDFPQTAGNIAAQSNSLTLHLDWVQG